MVALTMVDCSDPDNRVQARYELDRCEEYESSVEKMARLANWADKWGRALLDYANEAASEDDVNDAVNRVDNERGAELDKIRAEIADKIGDIRDALEELEQL